jgi:hypothetical protein
MYIWIQRRKNHEPLTSNSFKSWTHHRTREENPAAMFKEKPVLEASGVKLLLYTM